MFRDSSDTSWVYRVTREAVLLPLVAIAQVTDNVLPLWATTIIQFGSFGVLCYIIYWILTKHIPQLTKTFTDTVTAMMVDSLANRRTFEEQMKLRDLEIQRRDQQLIDYFTERKND